MTDKKQDEHEKRVAAGKKAARTRKRNEREQAQDPTTRTKPVGSKPTLETAKTEDVSARTAGLAVEKSGPDKPAANPDLRTNVEAEVQAAATSGLPQPNVEKVTDSRERARMEEERLAANQPRDIRIPLPQVDRELAVKEALEQRWQAASNWQVSERQRVFTAAATTGKDAVKVFTADQYVFIDTGSNEVMLTAAQAGDLVKKLQMAFQAVS